MTVTFRVCSNAPNVVNMAENPAPNFLTQLPEFKQDCGTVLQSSSVQMSSLLPQRNGFVQTVADCYNQHHNLVIRPDDFWLAVVDQFAFYVKGNSEALRHLFVEHQGQQQVEVVDIGSLKSVDYAALSKIMADKLRQRLQNTATDPNVADWILPQFSTTTASDVVVGSVMLMGTLKSYFTYKFSLLCGIPSVTLEGSVQDWEDVLSRVKKLSLYGGVCVKWSSMLESIAAQFAAASQGHANLEFWQRVCHYNGGGSGPTYLSGWITAFCVFDDKGKWQGDRTTVSTLMGTVDNLEFPVVATDDVPAGYVTVDVLVDDNGVEQKAKMFAGHMGSQLIVHLHQSCYGLYVC